MLSLREQNKFLRACLHWNGVSESVCNHEYHDLRGNHNIINLGEVSIKYRIIDTKPSCTRQKQSSFIEYGNKEVEGNNFWSIIVQVHTEEWQPIFDSLRHVHM